MLETGLKLSEISGEQKQTISSLRQASGQEGYLDATKNKKAQTPSSALRQAPTLTKARLAVWVRACLLSQWSALRSLMPPLLRQ